MTAILPYSNCFYKWTKYNSKQSHDTTAILISLWCALRLDQLFSTIYEKLNIWHFYEVSVVRLWWTSENHVSRYLFLEQIAHFLEGVLTFLRKAGDLIQRFSESTHIDVLNKACKMMKVRKKLNSFSSSVGSVDWPPWSEGQVEVLAQVEDVDRQPAHHEQAERGHQHQAAPDVTPLLRDPSVKMHSWT